MQQLVDLEQKEARGFALNNMINFEAIDATNGNDFAFAFLDI